MHAKPSRKRTMRTDPRAAIAAADTALGIEFGSTRIKAVLIGPDHEVLATGGHGWENHLEGGLWSYRLDEVVVGRQSAYASLVADVRERRGVPGRTRSILAAAPHQEREIRHRDAASDEG